MKLVIGRSLVLPSLAASGALVLAGSGAVAAVETETVSSFGRGIWWCLSLMTTVGFVGTPPTSTAGILLSIVLMVAGFCLLALFSAALASLFVREDERPFEARERATEHLVLGELRALRAEVERLQAMVSPDGRPGPDSSGR